MSNKKIEPWEIDDYYSRLFERDIDIVSCIWGEVSHIWSFEIDGDRIIWWDHPLTNWYFRIIYFFFFGHRARIKKGTDLISDINYAYCIVSNPYFLSWFKKSRT